MVMSYEVRKRILSNEDDKMFTYKCIHCGHLHSVDIGCVCKEHVLLKCEECGTKFLAPAYNLIHNILRTKGWQTTVHPRHKRYEQFLRYRKLKGITLW